jgi:glycosyltransferase involved in cell wall biosynthesis
MCFAPCREVGGKRFSFLSHYFSQWCGEYHVLARREKAPVEDSEAFVGNVRRLRMFPYYSPQTSNWITRQFLKIWARWLCIADPFFAWVIPAIFQGLRICRRYRIETIIVTVPYFSSLIAAIVLSRITGASLIVDYRDPWTNHQVSFPGIFGGFVSRFIERAAVRQASAIVFCSEIMKEQFFDAFASDAPDRLEVIYNGFDPRSEEQSRKSSDSDHVDMLYAGNFYGRRDLSVIAPVLAEMKHDGDISASDFQFHLYANLTERDRALIREWDLYDVVQVHGLVSYQEAQRLMRKADILFLLSGDDVSYAVPFKFFDYLRAKRPIFAVAPKTSMIARLMDDVDCGECADFASSTDIRRALCQLIAGHNSYSFAEADKFHWSNAAQRYFQLIIDVTSKKVIRGN